MNDDHGRAARLHCKIDNIIAVLAELAATRQVLVFSHDDRLPTPSADRQPATGNRQPMLES